MELSKHFHLSEFVTSNTAIRKGIDNTPSQEAISNLTKLCTQVLEPIRVQLEKPIKITSGYRCEKLNRLIGGAKNSQHILGEAADIQSPNLTTEELFQFIKDHFVYDQLIQEFDS